VKQIRRGPGWVTGPGEQSGLNRVHQHVLLDTSDLGQHVGVDVCADDGGPPQNDILAQALALSIPHPVPSQPSHNHSSTEPPGTRHATRTLTPISTVIASAMTRNATMNGTHGAVWSAASLRVVR
jgi:hypothetical protein